MMQHHGDQSGVERDARKIECGGIRDKGFDIRDVPFRLQALQIGERFGRGIDGIDESGGTDWPASNSVTKPGPGPTSKTRSPGLSCSASIQSPTSGPRCT